MKFVIKLHAWYKKNRRDLPWRQTRDPYKIWISEVILQQTRIDQGLNYYLRFIETFPDVASLAAASEEQVLKCWQGLGYYSRARNLHAAARHVAGHSGGRFPDSYEGLLKLKGVGNYTAAAISSICYGEARAVVDGNVSRVIARLYGIEEAVNGTAGKKLVAALADELLDRADPGTHNQALMEFGALHCVPHAPDCTGCPFEEECEARITGQVDQLPVKIQGRKPVDRWMYFYIYVCNGEIVLTRRNEQDIWKSLYQFPVVDATTPLTDLQIMKAPGQLATGTTIRKISPEVRHQLTHRTIHARFIHAELERWPDPLPSGWITVSGQRLNGYPVPQLIHRYMESINFSYL